VALLRGRYTVRAEISGFKTLEQRGLVLDPGQVLDLGELRLPVGALTETLNVQAETPVIEVGTSQKSYTISDTQIRELSLNGRDFTSLLKTLPGVATNDTGFRLAFNSTEGFMVNGLRQSMNNVMLDGTPNTDTGANDGQYTQLSLDAVGEFKLQNSAFNAEFGRNAGVLITSTTRSGGQQFHGTFYGFRRDGRWDAAPHDSLTGAKVPLSQQRRRHLHRRGRTHGRHRRRMVHRRQLRRLQQGRPPGSVRRRLRRDRSGAVGSPIGHVEVGPAVVVEIAAGDAERPPLVGHAGAAGDVGESEVAIVPEERGPGRRLVAGKRGARRAVDQVDVEPPVVVDID
jgi:hypothetical protein